MVSDWKVKWDIRKEKKSNTTWDLGNSSAQFSSLFDVIND